MKVHFLGIGGIGVSALAQYYLAKGHKVSGEDLSSSEITDFLQKLGIEIKIGKSTIEELQSINYKLPDLVIHTPAIKGNNLQLDFFKKAGVKCQTYPGALGELTKNYTTIAVSGSHGKSTTTSMLALAMIKAGLDPTVIVGTKLKEFGNTNFCMGKSQYLVIEACEYDSSFLNYKPQTIAITNIDKEHLDYFKTYANVKKAFKDFVMQLPRGGVLVANKDDKETDKISKSKFLISNQISISKYSLKQKEAKKIKKILQVPGTHNISNALAVLAIARSLKIEDKITYQALAEFHGTWRRFEEKAGTLLGFQISNFKFQIISDYGHHPNEVKATMQAVREKYKKQKIWLVFQPHQYQRTFYLQKDFIKIFRNAKIDNIIITDIYDVAGRENAEIINKINSEKLVKKIGRKSVIYLPQQDCENYIKNNIKSSQVLLIMGAGDIYKLFDKF